MNERRTDATPDTGHRRRESDRMEDFQLLRDKVLLFLGAGIAVVVLIAAIFGNIHNPEVALAVLGLASALLGAPTILRLDERRRK
jgi:hypothetical protein